jgi:amino acid transporter
VSSAPARKHSIARSTWRLLIGRPLRAKQISQEEITPVEGLSALSLDALTSVAYGPEAIIVVLAVAGGSALHLVLPITISIVALLAILVFSYRQVIDAYPGGGGAYAVTKDNFGPRASLLAAAALVVDYTLTVAVSIAAGVGTLTSAFPSLAAATVPICLAILAVVTVLNLRGLGETARAFLPPTMVFIVGLLAIIAVGLVHPLALHAPQPGHVELPTRNLQAVGILLILKAFSAGCSALTGVEAIANGVPLFKDPKPVRAKRTELLLGVILGVMLVGLAVLAQRWHVAPRSGQTVLSQIMGLAVGRHWAYYLVSLTITLVLALAANTSFGGLPVLASLLARDNYLPHLFALRGDRQVFANGIWALSVMSGALLIAVNGNTLTLIPLFAIGVFTGFTLSQAGLVVHWRKGRPERWRQRAAINGLGALVTAVATIVFLLTKFTQGAWVVVVAIPAFIALFLRIHSYYERAARALGIGEIPPKPHGGNSLVVVPVTGVSRLTEHAVSQALAISPRVVALSVALESEDSDNRIGQLQAQWDEWNPGVPLEILRTEYASIAAPLVGYVNRLRRSRPEQIVVLIPTVQPGRARLRLLHNQLDFVLSNALHAVPDVVVARVPMAMPVPPTGRRQEADGTAARDDGGRGGPPPSPSEEPVGP